MKIPEYKFKQGDIAISKLLQQKVFVILRKLYISERDGDIKLSKAYGVRYLDNRLGELWEYELEEVTRDR